MTIEKCTKSQENKKEKLRFLSYQSAISISWVYRQLAPSIQNGKLSRNRRDVSGVVEENNDIPLFPVVSVVRIEFSSSGTIVSSLSQGSSESHQTAFPYNRPDRLRGRRRSLRQRRLYGNQA